MNLQGLFPRSGFRFYGPIHLSPPHLHPQYCGHCRYRHPYNLQRWAYVVLLVGLVLEVSMFVIKIFQLTKVFKIPQKPLA